MMGKTLLGKVGPVLAVALLAGCSTLEMPSLQSNVPIEEMTAQQIFEEGNRLQARGNPEEAARYYGEIERLFPYSELASVGLVLQAQAYHDDKNYPASRAAAERYLTFYPTRADAAQAQYLIALSYFDPIFDIGRDRGLIVNALQEMRLVFERYPNSAYAEPARQQFDEAFDHLAGKEIEVGRFYLGQGEYGAAINRFRVIVEDFPTTRFTPEALYRLVEANMALGLTSEARQAAALLQTKFTDSVWTADALALLGGTPVEASGSGWLAGVYRKALSGDWL
jgi:outer membrane protein assembly factor BamD